MSINAQQLEPFISTAHNGSVTYIAMNVIDDTLWVSGVQKDNLKGIIWKYSDKGVLLDSIVFPDAENQVIFNFIPYGDSVVTIGTHSPATDEGQLVIRCLDKNLNQIWTKTFDYPYNPYILGFRTFERFNKRFIAIQTPVTQFFKLDKQFNVLETKSMETIYNFEPVKFTNRGFHFAKNGGWIVEIDTNFNEVDTLFHGYGFLVSSGNLMSNGNNGYIGTSQNLESYYQINYRDSNYQIVNNYPFIGHQDEHPRYTFYRTMLPNHDTTRIFASGFLNQNQVPHPVHLGSWDSNKFWVAYLNQDSMLWYRFYEDSIYYYLTTNMALGSDGSLYLAASRYNAAEQADYSDAVIFKFNTEGDMLVGNKPEPQLQKAVKVYPNPGTNQLNIEIPEPANSTILLYNIQGKLVQSKQFRKQCQLNTEGLTQGIYFYRILTKPGEVFTGKWIKE